VGVEWHVTQISQSKNSDETEERIGQIENENALGSIRAKVSEQPLE